MIQLMLDFDNPGLPFERGEVEPGIRFDGKIALEDLFNAYFDCRKNKRRTVNALEFELNYEENIMQLWRDINDGAYTIGRSIAFIVEKPVKREIFAADFRDRIVQHLLINKFIHLFEKEFIYDSYSCRKGRGTLFGVKRLNRFIRSCSENYTKDCYVLKLDVQGFFMSIRRDKMFDMIFELVGCNYYEPDRDILLHLTELVIMNDCTDQCVVKSSRKKWDGLPSNKSLFGNDALTGLPIGNFTSQVFANYYLGKLDHFIKSGLGIRYYSRYVDDFVLVHPDKDYLYGLIPAIRDFLEEELCLTLHPKKIVLQHYKKGVKFAGSYILPNRIYIERRTKGNFYHLIDRWNATIRSREGRDKLNNEEVSHFQASVNSYLGFMRHYKTYRLRKKMLLRMSARFDKYYQRKNQFTKLTIHNKKSNETNRIYNRLFGTPVQDDNRTEPD